MRNLVPILFVALAFGAITCKQFTTDERIAGTSFGLEPIPNKYVVFLASAYAKPLVEDTTVYNKVADSIYSARNKAKRQKTVLPNLRAGC